MPITAHPAPEALLEEVATTDRCLRPTVRDCMFFDARGRALSSSRTSPSPEAELNTVQRCVDESLRRDVDVITRTSSTECIAVIRLRSEGSFAKACAVSFRVDSNASNADVEWLSLCLNPFLSHVICALSGATRKSTHRLQETQHERELAWLLTIVPPCQPDPQSSNHTLEQVIEEVVGHFRCDLGAILIPERSVRVVHRTDSMEGASAVLALERLSGPLLRAVRRKGGPIVMNYPGVAKMGSHMMAVPVTVHTKKALGLLILFRAREGEPFSRFATLLGQHVSRRISAVLEAEFAATTGLLTRAGLERQVRARDAPAGSGYDESSILCLNIDRLHVLNETRGFEAGDQLIAQVAELLRGPLLPSGGLVAHLFGAEFAVVLPHTPRAGAVGIAEGFQKAAEEHGTNDEPVSVSCGIAFFQTSGAFQEGLACAELACKAARDRGGGRVEVFQRTDASMIRRFDDGINLRLLRDALRQEGHLVLFAQKIVSAHGHDESSGYEILLRSAESQHANVAPAALLAAAERNQMCSQLDWWVIERTISEASHYRTELISRRAYISINVSGPSLTDDGFVDRVHSLICSSGLSPALITFELVESAAVSLSTASSCIARMSGLGYRFALDDFGIGNNSLKTLTSLPVHCVKIDGSFVRDILVNSQSEATVRAIVSLAKDLRISTVAEYAESAAIIERLRDLGVDYVQGYGVEHPRLFGDALRSLR